MQHRLSVYEDRDVFSIYDSAFHEDHDRNDDIPRSLEDDEARMRLEDDETDRVANIA